MLFEMFTTFLKFFLKDIFLNVPSVVLNNNICYSSKMFTTFLKFLGNIFLNAFLVVLNNNICDSVKMFTTF